jgi:hypothetical protein
MNGKWDERNLEDKFREIMIILVLLALLIPAYRYRSLVILCFSIAAFIQHIFLLVNGHDWLPTEFVKWITWWLAFIGFWYMDIFVSFAGTYSALTKIDLRIFPEYWVSSPELNKFFTSFVVWLVTYLFLKEIQRRGKGRERFE